MDPDERVGYHAMACRAKPGSGIEDASRTEWNQSMPRVQQKSTGQLWTGALRDGRCATRGLGAATPNITSTSFAELDAHNCKNPTSLIRQSSEGAPQPFFQQP
jgi:hypothetical protein